MKIQNTTDTLYLSLLFSLIIALMALNENLRRMGLHLAELRKRKGISQSELARRMDKDQQSYQRVESGNINPTFEYLQEISKALEISLAEMFKDLE